MYDTFSFLLNVFIEEPKEPLETESSPLTTFVVDEECMKMCKSPRLAAPSLSKICISAHHIMIMWLT